MNMFCNTRDPTNVQRTKICEYARNANMKLRHILLASLIASWLHKNTANITSSSFNNWHIEHDWSEFLGAGDITHLAPPFVQTPLYRQL